MDPHCTRPALLWRALGKHLPPEALRIGFRLYGRFRPKAPAGAAGWGKQGILDLQLIENAWP